MCCVSICSLILYVLQIYGFSKRIKFSFILIHSKFLNIFEINRQLDYFLFFLSSPNLFHELPLALSQSHGFQFVIVLSC